MSTVMHMSINPQSAVDPSGPRQKGPGEHKYDRRGSLILPSVAYGTPAQKREELLSKILRERIWVHFARAAITEFVATSSSISSAFTSHVRSMGISSKSTRSRMSEHKATGSKMLPIGVLVAFDIPPANEGGLEAALEQFAPADAEGLVQHLNMSARVVEFLLPHIDQVKKIEEMIAPYEDAFDANYEHAESVVSSAAASSLGRTDSASDGAYTPFEHDLEASDKGEELANALAKTLSQL